MALKAPAGMRFKINVGAEPCLAQCTLPMEDLTIDLSGEAGVLIRNHGKNDVVIQKSMMIAMLTVQNAPTRMRTVKQLRETIQRQRNRDIRAVIKEYRKINPGGPSGKPAVTRLQKGYTIKAYGAELPAKNVESRYQAEHLLSKIRSKTQK